MSRWCHPLLCTLGVLLAPSYARAAEPGKLECLAANDAAQDLRRAGKLHEAREKLSLCVSASCPGPVRDDCAQRLVEVDAAMPSIVFEAKDARGKNLSEVRVQVDGQPFAERIDGAPRPIDPGSHRFVFDGADGAHAEQTVVVQEREKGSPVRVVLGTLPPPVAPPSGSEWTTQKTIGVAVGGAGVVGLVVGSIFGATALSDANGLKSQPGCPSSCPPSTQSQIDTLHGHQWASDIGLGLGVVGLAVGAVLFLTSHAPEAAPATALRFDVGPGVLGLRGGF